MDNNKQNTARLPHHRMSDLATKGDIGNALAGMVSPLYAQVERLTAECTAMQCVLVELANQAGLDIQALLAEHGLAPAATIAPPTEQ